MPGKTKIEWATDTWNCAVGCSQVSDECRSCYAMTQAPRQAGKGLYEGVVADGDWTGRVNLGGPEALDWPLRATRPRRIFVNSMSDLFHEAIPEEWIAEVFARMGLAEQHQFMVLTKRPQRMARVVNSERFRSLWFDARERRASERDVQAKANRGALTLAVRWPLPNVMLGTSVGRQRYAFRVRHLLLTDAAVRFVSAEPLLEALDLSTYVGPGGVDWVIAGGESGRTEPRPMHPAWARSLRDQCERAGVPFLFKQWGEWAPAGPRWSESDLIVRGDGYSWPLIQPHGAEDGTGYAMRRVGKHAAGRELDGHTWDGYPEGWGPE